MYLKIIHAYTCACTHIPQFYTFVMVLKTVQKFLYNVNHQRLWGCALHAILWLMFDLTHSNVTIHVQLVFHHMCFRWKIIPFQCMSSSTLFQITISTFRGLCKQICLVFG